MSSFLSEEAKTDLINRIKGHNNIQKPIEEDTSQFSSSSRYSDSTRSSDNTSISVDEYSIGSDQWDNFVSVDNPTIALFDIAKGLAEGLLQKIRNIEKKDNSSTLMPPLPPESPQKHRLSDKTKDQLIQIILNRHKKLYLESLLQKSHTLATSTLNSIPPNNTIEPVLQSTTGLTSDLLEGLKPQENTIEPVLRTTTGLASDLLKGLQPPKNTIEPVLQTATELASGILGELQPPKNTIEPVLQTATELASGILKGLGPQENTIEPVIRLALTKANDVLGELQKQSNPSVAVSTASTSGPASTTAKSTVLTSSATKTESDTDKKTNTLGDLILNGEAFRMAADGKSMNPVLK